MTNKISPEVAYLTAQIYSTFIVILFTPYLLKIYGVESYGVIAFTTTCFAWLQVLDLGMSSALSRDIAANSKENLRRVVELIITLIYTFIIIGLMISITLIIFSNNIINLLFDKHQSIDLLTIFQLFLVTFFFRWISIVLRAILYGEQKFYKLSFYLLLFSSARYFGVIPWVYFNGNNIEEYFIFQLTISIIELFFLGVITFDKKYKKTEIWLNLNFKPIISILPVAGNLAIAGLIWTALTQLDKLLLIKNISLKDYGIFSVAVLASSGISIVINPLISTLIPKFCKEYTSWSEITKIAKYRMATRIVGLIASFLLLTLVFQSENIIYIWTGNNSIAKDASLILALYSIGFFIQIIAGMPYLLQFASGDLRLHTRGSILMILVYIPILYILIKILGGVGAGISWIIINLIYICVWVPYVHSKFMHSYKNIFFLLDAFKILAIAIGPCFMFYFIMPNLSTITNSIMWLGLWLLFLVFLFSLFKDCRNIFYMILLGRGNKFI